jgi:hypothetical protein
VEGFSAVALRYGYDAAGRRASLGLGAGSVASTASYSYDAVGRLASLGHMARQSRSRNRNALRRHDLAAAAADGEASAILGRRTPFTTAEFTTAEFR